jgi:hypothetical protein
MSENNPFYHRGPIRRPGHFHNRQREVQRALRLLRQGQCISVVGPRKIGKTSLLFHLAHFEVLQRYGLSPSQYLCVYFDCEGLRDLTRSEIYRYILDEIDEKLGAGGLEMALELKDERRIHWGFVRTIKRVRKERQLILMFDGFERMCTNSHLGTDFFSSLRALAIEQEIAFVTASEVPLTQIPSAEPDSLLTSHFFNIFSPFSLSLFTATESQRLIEDSLHNAGLVFAPDTLDWVLRAGGRHPFFLQIAGDRAYEQRTIKGAALGPADYEAMEQGMAREAVGHFKYYWEDLNSQEQYVLAALSWLRGKSGYAQILASLRDKCLIVGDCPGCTYFTPLFGKFVVRQPVQGLLRAGSLVVDQNRREALLHESPLELTDLMYDLLAYLMERKGQTVSREELDREVWWPADATEGEERVKAGIKALRRALSDDSWRIVARRGQGYELQDLP